MAHENTVVRSINLDGALLCVDIFTRADGSFGFELFRRDPEDARGWYPIGVFGDTRYRSEAEATEAACLKIPWLREKLVTIRGSRSVARQRTRQ
mgnify:FL=1